MQVFILLFFSFFLIYESLWTIQHFSNSMAQKTEAVSGYIFLLAVAQSLHLPTAGSARLILITVVTPWLLFIASSKWSIYRGRKR